MSFLSVLLIIVVNYNVENLFHPAHDSLKDDYEWTPEGERHWSYTRYSNKVDNISRVLTNVGGWEGVDIVGLQEVENALCVDKLCYTLRHGEYGFVLYESPDPRGIDVALIFKKTRIDTIRTRAIRVSGLQVTGEGLRELRTRDILYVCAQVDKQDTVHFLVCHLPSQRGGAAETEWKRKAVKSILQAAVDSIYLINTKANIIVMGDMNGAPKNDLKGLSNRMEGTGVMGYGLQVTGTHKYQGRWTCLDQFYTSPSIDSISEVYIYDAKWIQEKDEKYTGLKPKRTYNGIHYQNGYSDHLPIVLQLK